MPGKASICAQACKMCWTGIRRSFRQATSADSAAPRIRLEPTIIWVDNSLLPSRRSSKPIPAVAGRDALLMRLLDLIAQRRAARVITEDGSELPSADRFSEAVRDCPTRYVLSDELTRCATQLAYAEGDRLS